ncbi:Uncharacterised protein [uncultured archaeon]|nr:Uncharacterised protein [uncultured archaeon]
MSERGAEERGGTMKYIVILAILLGAVFSGCVADPQSQHPLYYDEKAIYLINKSITAMVTEDYSSLVHDAKNNYNELNKLIVSPEMQPAVDEYALALTDFQSAEFDATKYKDWVDFRKTCVPNEYETCETNLPEIWGGIFDTDFKSGTDHLNNTVKLLPAKYLQH